MFFVSRIVDLSAACLAVFVVHSNLNVWKFRCFPVFSVLAVLPLFGAFVGAVLFELSDFTSMRFRLQSSPFSIQPLWPEVVGLAVAAFLWLSFKDANNARH